MKQRFQTETQNHNSVDHDGVHDTNSVIHDGDHEGLNETELKILSACQSKKSTPEILKVLGYGSRTRNYRTALGKLIDNGLVLMTQPDKPRSKSQQYFISEQGMKVLSNQDASND